MWEKVGGGAKGGQTYHQSVFFRSVHGALIWNRSKTGSILVNEGDRWVIFPLDFGFGDKIITRWRGERWKQTVRAATSESAKGSRGSPTRRAPSLSKCSSLRPAAVFVGRHWEAAILERLGLSRATFGPKKKVPFAEAQRANPLVPQKYCENVKHQKQIFISEFVQAASSPKLRDANLDCTLNNR